MRRVLVLDADQRSALAVTRSLGRQGVSVVTADESRHALAGCSRHSERHVTYPSPRSQPEPFVSAIADLCVEKGIGLILPMTELTTLLLLRHRGRFPYVTLPFPAADTVASLADKCALMRLAESLGVPTPATWHIESIGNLNLDLAALPYPLVLKPGQSWLEGRDGWFQSGVRLAETPAQAASILETEAAFQAPPFLLQESISGHGQGVFALYDRGHPIAFFMHRRLREKPPWGGVSVLSESVPVDKKLVTHARRLLDGAGWHGVAMVEFKVSEDGTPYLMEINTRFWGSLQLAIDAGVDFPWLLYRMACGEPIEAIQDYRTGIRLRWLLGDLDHLYLVLKDGSYTPTRKLKGMLSFLTPDPFRTRHEVDRWGDMGPFRRELRNYIRAI